MSPTPTEAKIEIRYLELVALAREYSRQDLPSARSELYDLSRRLHNLADELGEQVREGVRVMTPEEAAEPLCEALFEAFQTHDCVMEETLGWRGAGFEWRPAHAGEAELMTKAALQALPVRRITPWRVWRWEQLAAELLDGLRGTDLADPARRLFAELLVARGWLNGNGPDAFPGPCEPPPGPSDACG